MTNRKEQAQHPLQQEALPQPRSFRALLILAACIILAFAGFLALGSWQLQRLQWKTALIERIEQRAFSAPVPAPAPERWPHITAESDEYRRVRIAGVFLHDRTTHVQASTRLGSGYWVMTPLRTADGHVILVNRGFVSSAQKQQHTSSYAAAQATAGPAAVTGLLRMSEPGWSILRRNDPVSDRWYTRDIAAIAAARNLSSVAPFFVDADASQSAAAPAGGLTVLTFPNNHLVYALTWFALALMVAGAAGWIVYDERRLRRRAGGAG